MRKLFKNYIFQVIVANLLACIIVYSVDANEYAEWNRADNQVSYFLGDVITMMKAEMNEWGTLPTDKWEVMMMIQTHVRPDDRIKFYVSHVESDFYIIFAVADGSTRGLLNSVDFAMLDNQVLMKHSVDQLSSDKARAYIHKMLNPVYE